MEDGSLLNAGRNSSIQFTVVDNERNFNLIKQDFLQMICVLNLGHEEVTHFEHISRDGYKIGCDRFVDIQFQSFHIRAILQIQDNNTLDGGGGNCHGNSGL